MEGIWGSLGETQPTPQFRFQASLAAAPERLGGGQYQTGRSGEGVRGHQTRHRERGLACLPPHLPSEPPGTLPCTDRIRPSIVFIQVYPLCAENTHHQPCWIQGNDYNQQELPVGPRYNGEDTGRLGSLVAHKFFPSSHKAWTPELAHRVSFLIETVGK